MKYSQEVREAVTRKALSRQESQEAIAQEFGIAVTTVQNWLRQYRRSGVAEVVNGERWPEDWAVEERLSALIDSGALSSDERGAWCRGRGLHTHHLERWRRAVVRLSQQLVLKAGSMTLNPLRIPDRPMFYGTVYLETSTAASPTRVYL